MDSLFDIRCYLPGNSEKQRSVLKISAAGKASLAVNFMEKQREQRKRRLYPSGEAKAFEDPAWAGRDSNEHIRCFYKLSDERSASCADTGQFRRRHA